MTPRQVERRLAAALRELDPGARVAQALGARPMEGLPASVIAMGKAAPAMAAGAIARWGDGVGRCLVIAPRGTDVRALELAARAARITHRVRVMRGGHPLPDTGSLRAADACLDLARGPVGRGAAPGRHAVLVLVSGGASALVCAPIAGVSLDDKRAITRAMLASGAPIEDVNVVRKHLSRIKGGGLLRAASGSPVVTLIASDVVGGDPSSVGSGPSVPDPSRVRTARRLLLRWAPSFADVPLAETLLPESRGARGARARIIVSPEELARTFAMALRSEGIRARVLPPSVAEAASLAEEYLACASRASRRGLAAGPVAFIRAAEPSVSVPPRAGRGGRSTHLAALVGRALGHLALARGTRLTFAALATDGVDGVSGTGGAVVDASWSARVRRRLGASALDHALGRFDTGPLHVTVGSAIPGGPSGHNLADLHVLVIGA